MKHGLGFPLFVGLLLLLILAVIQISSPVVDVEKHNEVIDQVQSLKQINNELNQHLFDVSANRIRHYSYVSQGQQDLAASLISLNEILSPIRGFDQKTIEKLNKNIEQKNEFLERFKQKHARFKNSLDYYPLLASEIHQSSTDTNMVNFYERVAQTVVYYALSGDRVWKEQAEGTLRKLQQKLERMPSGKSKEKTYLINFIAHSSLIVEGTGSLSTLSRIEHNLAINDTIDAVNQAYLDHYEQLTKEQEKYQQYLFALIFGFVFLVAYMLILVSRNTIALAREKQRAEVTLSSIANGVIVTDERGLVQYLNPIAEQHTEITTANALGHPVEDIFKVVMDNSGGQLAENSVRTCLRTGQPAITGEHAILITNHENEVVVEHSAAPIKNENGQIEGVVMVFDDVTTAYRMARKLEHQATHDALTGLVNRREFENRISEAIITSKQDIKTHVLLYLDLDQFKIVNDTCGHVAGDELLKQVVEEIKQLLRASDTFARLGGDEFGILLGYCTITPAKRLAEKILKAVQDYRFSWSGKTFQIGVSIGVIPITPESDNLASVLSAADMACYSAKDAGRNRIHVYEASDQEVAARKGEMNWVARINNALDNNTFVLYGQKIIPLNKDSNEHHQELLIRMVDEEEGFHIPPGAFLPAAARYNSMFKIDSWVISNAFKFYSSQSEEEKQNSQLCINLSGDSLIQGELLSFIVSQKELNDVNPAHVCFEITETEAVTNLNQAREIITTLKELGFKFALDDFGSGMSSFSYLKNLPVNYLKIDGSLVKDIADDDVSRAMVEMITRIGHIMGMKTIAEFVENDEIIAVLKEIGVDYGQGYGIDMPKLIFTPQSN